MAANSLPGPRRRLWTRKEYYRLFELGLFDEQRVELIGGVVILRPQQSNRYAVSMTLTAEALRGAFGPGYWVRVLGSLDLSRWSVPDPELAVVEGAPRSHVNDLGNPTSALLIVEVSETTLRFDRGRKGSLYARSGIADYWILNLVDRQLEVYFRLGAGQPPGFVRDVLDRPHLPGGRSRIPFEDVGQQGLPGVEADGEVIPGVEPDGDRPERCIAEQGRPHRPPAPLRDDQARIPQTEGVSAKIGSHAFRLVRHSVNRCEDRGVSVLVLGPVLRAAGPLGGAPLRVESRGPRQVEPVGRLAVAEVAAGQGEPEPVDLGGRGVQVEQILAEPPGQPLDIVFVIQAEEGFPDGGGLHLVAEIQEGGHPFADRGPVADQRLDLLEGIPK
jgi:hypothetical protein